MSGIDFSRLDYEVARVVDDHINGLFPDLPPISWHYTRYKRLSGHVPESAYDDLEAVAQAWRLALGFGEAVDSRWGTRSFAGVIDGVSSALVWYVTDRAKFANRER